LPTVERVSKLEPQLQVTLMVSYDGCVSGFITASVESVFAFGNSKGRYREKAENDTLFVCRGQVDCRTALKRQDFCPGLVADRLLCRLQTLQAMQEPVFASNIFPQQSVDLQTSGHRGTRQVADLVQLPLQTA
jgi:hypothetical protein